MSTPAETARRDAVLESALHTFARFGYRKTSMDDVAREAQISRPGLYFLFSSKAGLFQAAADRGIDQDLRQAELALATPGQAIGERVAEAFDCWAGRYIGPLHDVTAVLDDNPDLLGPIARGGPSRFEQILTDALRTAGVHSPPAVAKTLISTSIGIKHQSADRPEYAERMRTAIDLLVNPG